MGTGVARCARSSLTKRTKGDSHSATAAFESENADLILKDDLPHVDLMTSLSGLREISTSSGYFSSALCQGSAHSLLLHMRTRSIGGGKSGSIGLRLGGRRRRGITLLVAVSCDERDVHTRSSGPELSCLLPEIGCVSLGAFETSMKRKRKES